MDDGAPARRRELFQHRHPIAPGAEPHGGGEAAKAAADDDRVRADRREGRGRLGAVECQHEWTVTVSIHVAQVAADDFVRVWNGLVLDLYRACLDLFGLGNLHAD